VIITVQYDYSETALPEKADFVPTSRSCLQLHHEFSQSKRVEDINSSRTVLLLCKLMHASKKQPATSVSVKTSTQEPTWPTTLCYWARLWLYLFQFSIQRRLSSKEKALH